MHLERFQSFLNKSASPKSCQRSSFLYAGGTLTKWSQHIFHSFSKKKFTRLEQKCVNSFNCRAKQKCTIFLLANFKTAVCSGSVAGFRPVFLLFCSDNVYLVFFTFTYIFSLHVCQEKTMKFEKKKCETQRIPCQPPPLADGVVCLLWFYLLGGRHTLPWYGNEWIIGKL